MVKDLYWCWLDEPNKWINKYTLEQFHSKTIMSSGVQKCFFNCFLEVYHTKDTSELDFKGVKIDQDTSNVAFLITCKYCSSRRIGYWSSDIVSVFTIISLMHLGTGEDLTLAVEKLSHAIGILLQKPCKSVLWQRSRIGPNSC